MRIIDNTGTCNFDRLKIGDVFKSCGKVYMKIAEVKDAYLPCYKYNSVCLENGDLNCVSEKEEVLPRTKSEIIVK